MVFKVTYSEKASDDLSDIIRYISYKLNSPQAAERFFTKVLQKIEWLRENPYLFPLYHDEKLSADGCDTSRRIAIRPYKGRFPVCGQ